MNKKDILIIVCALLFGLVIWFFPRTVDPVKFLGFSSPFLLPLEKG
ncbi:MAG: hypothetical protein OXH36_03420 [Bdellovibrionales bacterium]|nr:hypothetical protein [Bdellovibrionales bacterium]